MAESLISQPSNDPVDRYDEPTRRLVGVNPTWRNFFVAVFNLLTALTGSGTTARRPTAFLFTGRPYFDTTLGLPIWWNGADWIDAAGAVV